jgi:hypothetical protein
MDYFVTIGWSTLARSDLISCFHARSCEQIKVVLVLTFFFFFEKAQKSCAFNLIGNIVLKVQSSYEVYYNGHKDALVNVSCHWEHNHQARGTCSGPQCHLVLNPSNYHADRRSGSLEHTVVEFGVACLAWDHQPASDAMRSSGLQVIRSQDSISCQSAARTNSPRPNEALFLALRRRGILAGVIDSNAQGDLCPASVLVGEPVLPCGFHLTENAGNRLLP